MKVLVTGSNGFIGKNLISNLREIEDVTIIEYDKGETFDLIENNIDDIDFIFHLAGVNRPKEVSEFYDGNADLTKQIVDLLKFKKLKTPILITSSIQAIKDNDYGKSKKMAEDYVLDYGKIAPAYVYRLHNVFGKWSKPNYNSVVSTFCHNVANDLEVTIHDENISLELIYIDDIIRDFVRLLSNNEPLHKNGDYCYIEPRYNVTLLELYNLIKSFQDSLSSIYVPATGDDFIKKLYSTYISYVPIEKFAVSTTKNVDHRGSFVELVRTKDSGQFSVSISNPGVVRGNHYHHTKVERFIVIKGTAKIGFTHIITGENYEFEVNENDIKVVTIPVGYTHNIENIGNDEMILLIWCNELFDKEKPDTFFMPVK